MFSFPFCPEFAAIMNCFRIVRFLLIVFQTLLLAMMIVLFARSLVMVVRRRPPTTADVSHHLSMAYTGSEIVSLIFGLVGSCQVNFVYTTIFALLQCCLIVFELFFTVTGWLYVLWFGNALLATILATMIKKGYSLEEEEENV